MGGVFVEISSWSITFVKLETLNYLDKWKWTDEEQNIIEGIQEV